jgi:hypothetical protein
MSNLNRPMLATHRNRPRARTIDWTEETGDRVRTASRYLGLSGHKFIQRAIQHELERTYGCMALNEKLP